VHAELGAEEGPGAAGRTRVDRGGARKLGCERRFGAGDSRDQCAVSGSPRQRLI